MSNNPLQQYFRQPKIYISLPSQGVFNAPGTVDGDVTNMPVYGMTGLDEILIKTPDALLNGEATVKVIESCCPNIKNGWEVNSIDINLLLIAIRIATYGNAMTITHTCSKCGTENDIKIELGKLVEHFTNCRYNNILKTSDLSINLQPVTYKQSTEFAVRNFKIQQHILQANSITDDEERNSLLKSIFEELAALQFDVFAATIESVDTGTVRVNDPTHIREWLNNVERDIFDLMKKHNDTNRAAWETPPVPVTCSSCGHEANTIIEMDHSSFFANA